MLVLTEKIESVLCVCVVWKATNFLFIRFFYNLKIQWIFSVHSIAQNWWMKGEGAAERKKETIH